MRWPSALQPLAVLHRTSYVYIHICICICIYIHPYGTTPPHVATSPFGATSPHQVAQHALNRNSSRSHALYMVQIERRSRMHSSGTLQPALTLALTLTPSPSPSPNPDSNP